MASGSRISLEEADVPEDMSRMTGAQKLKKVLKIIADDEGRIQSGKLREYVKQRGLDFTDEEIDEMMEVADASETGEASSKGLIKLVQEHKDQFPDVKVTHEELKKELTMISHLSEILSETPKASRASRRGEETQVVPGPSDRKDSRLSQRSNASRVGNGTKPEEHNKGVMSTAKKKQSKRKVKHSTEETEERAPTTPKPGPSTETAQVVTTDTKMKVALAVIADENGRVTSSKVRDFMEKEGYDFSEEQIKEMLKVGHISGKGEVSDQDLVTLEKKMSQVLSKDKMTREELRREITMLSRDEVFVPNPSRTDDREIEASEGGSTFRETASQQSDREAASPVKRPHCNSRDQARRKSRPHADSEDTKESIAVNINGLSRDSMYDDPDDEEESEEDDEDDETHEEEETPEGSSLQEGQFEETEQDTEHFDEDEEGVYYAEEGDYVSYGHTSRKSYVPDKSIDIEVDTAMGMYERVGTTRRSREPEARAGRERSKSKGDNKRKSKKTKAKPTTHYKPRRHTIAEETVDPGYYSAIGCAYKLSQIRTRQRLLYLMWRVVFDQAVRRTEHKRKVKNTTRRRKHPVLAK